MALVQSTMRATSSSKTTSNVPGLDFTSNIGPEVNAFALPTRRMADSFMSLWVPQSESFSDNVSGKAEDPIFLSTLNIVFAIGCQFSDLVAPDRRTNLGDQFYQRSRALYDIDALDSASILTVQMLLLTGLYLQSTKYASRCWHMVGLAIRTAQDIGIHIEHTRPSKTQLEREMRRRQDGEGIQPSQSECSMRFFVFSIQLFEILDRIMSKIYRYESVNPSNEGGEDFWWSRDRLEDVLKLNNALDDWHDTLPNNLRLQCATEARADLRSHTAILQAKVLYSRFLYIRILLLRPALLSAAQNRHHLPKGDDWRHLRLEEQLALKMRFIEVQVGVQFIHKLQIQSAAHAVRILETLQHRVALVCEAEIDGLDRDHSKPNEPVNSNTFPGDDYTLNSDSQDDLLQFNELETNRLSEAWFMEQIGNIDWLVAP
ncbi:hypothetical protein CNMCM8927_002243 [Aspergillus lentulus]|uniref:Xylanolytic transcriptional activator regulatory domain-containing protein n=1 Tax=Aspergillus lentulus TaxID=293939 RepID=A0AAN5YHA6_ASPLE|nr:hypothetical protein CNMCM8927_002243 [Aspergillus lentulus]